MAQIRTDRRLVTTMPIAVIITKAGEILYSPIDHVGEQEAINLESNTTPLGSDFAIKTSEPTPTKGVSVVGMTADNTTFIEILDGKCLVYSDPWKDPIPSSKSAHAITQWFNNAYVSRLEFPWQDFSSPERKKDFLEVKLTLERHSRCYIGIYCETDSGRRYNRWKGLAFGHEDIRVPIKLSGRKLRLRVVAVMFNDARAVIKNVVIGLNPTGSD